MFYHPKRAWRGYPEIRIKSQKHAPDAGERAFRPRKPVMKTKWILRRKTKNRKAKKRNVKNTCIMGGSLGGSVANRVVPPCKNHHICATEHHAAETEPRCMIWFVKQKGFVTKNRNNAKNRKHQKHKVICKSGQHIWFLPVKMNANNVTTTSNPAWEDIVLLEACCKLRLKTSILLSKLEGAMLHQAQQ